MLHPLRDIAVLFDASDTGDRVLNIAAHLAQAQQAHLVAVSTAQHPTDIANGFARGAASPPHSTMKPALTPPAPRS